MGERDGWQDGWDGQAQDGWDGQAQDDWDGQAQGGMQQPAGRGDGRKRGLSLRAKGIITLLVVAAYALFPADLVPDAMVGLGQVDDALVFAAGVASILMGLRKPRG